MEVSIFSDLHIHNYKKFDDNNSRLKNCLRVLSDIFKFNAGKGIEYSLFCGDFYDNQKMLPSVVVNETVNKLTKLFYDHPDHKIIAITGNHDQATKNLMDSQAVSSLEHLATIFPNNFILLDNKIIEIGGVVLCGIPYYEYPEHFNIQLEKASKKILAFKNKGMKVILMCHQTPSGLGNINIPVDTNVNDPLYDNFDFILNGHIHMRQKITDKFYIVGSPIHRDLSDVDQEKGFLTMNINKFDGVMFWDINKVSDFKYPKFIKVDLSLEKEIEDKDNYVVPIAQVDKSLLSSDDDVSVKEFGSDLKAEVLLRNYWEEVDGKNKELLNVGLKLLK